MIVGNRDIKITGGYARLFSSGFLTIKEVKEGPSVAFTTWDKVSARYDIYLRSDALENYDDHTLEFLIHHEIGHVILGHFTIDCQRPDAMIAADIGINYHLRADDNLIRELDGVIAKEWLEELQLEYKSHPVTVLHDILHEDMDAGIQQAIENFKNGGPGTGSSMCGGIEVTDDPAAVATALAARGELSEEEKEALGGQAPGAHSLGANVSSMAGTKPEWANKLAEFAQNVVQLVVADKRTYRRPHAIAAAYGLHVPTRQPSWAYKPDTVILLVDTSGSMLDYIKQIGPTIAFLNSHEIKCRIVAGDTRVLFDEEVVVPPTTLPGGGGTDIIPIWDRGLTYEPKAVVCFSDGYVMRWPSDPGIPTLWIMDKEVTAPFGQQVAAK